MKLKVNRYGLSIYPEQYGDSTRNTEIAFIEEVLGLKNAGDFVLLERENSIGLSALACLETKKPRGKISSIEYTDGSSDLFLDLPDKLMESLKKEAGRLGITAENFVLNIIKNELDKESK